MIVCDEVFPLSLFHLFTFLPFRILTAAVLLVIEVKFFQQLITAFIEATLAPVLRPKDSSFDSLLCQMAGILYLFQTFPTRGRQRSSEVFDTEFFGFSSCNSQTERKAQFTATASLWFSFESTDVLPPMFVVVVAINPCESETLCMALTLVLADLILLKRIDIRIVIEYHRTNIVLHQPLDNRRGTRGTTGMQQNLSAPVWNNNRCFFHLLYL